MNITSEGPPIKFPIYYRLKFSLFVSGITDRILLLQWSHLFYCNRNPESTKITFF